MIYARCVLFLIIGTLGIAEAAKRCDTQEVWGSRYHGDVDGLYDVTDMRCHGRPVYVQRGVAVNPKYIYYFWDTLLRIGWIVGTNPCANDRMYASAYVWNLNRRPDRGLLAWLEYDQSDRIWRINGGFEVRCTEGLTYPQIVGIVAGCLFGVVAIVVIVVILCQSCDKEDSRVGVQRRRNSSDPPPYRAPGAQNVQVIYTNNAYENPSAPTDIPGNYTYFPTGDPYSAQPANGAPYPPPHVTKPTNQLYY